MDSNHQNHDEKEPLIEGHEYDGIQELDHPLPAWWVFAFYGTVVFSFFYYLHFEILDGPSSDQELVVAMEDFEKKKSQLAEKAEAKSVDISKIDFNALRSDQAALKTGQAVYNQYCASCHVADGGGSIGPNLADAYWIHSDGGAPGILAAINEGFPEKGMPAWKNLVPEASKAPLVAFVLNFQGTKPANPKAPQGERVGAN